MALLVSSSSPPPPMTPEEDSSSSLISTPEYSGAITEVSTEKVHVAVSRSVAKGVELLVWTFRQFRSWDVVLVHVHRPSLSIPTLLGNIPANQANQAVVKAHRREEEDNMNKILDNYVNLCISAKVKVSKLLIENRNIHEGIVELICKHDIRNLVMGISTASFPRVTRSLNKADYTAKHAPQFCKIFFVHKNKLVETRQATHDPASPYGSSELISVHSDEIDQAVTAPLKIERHIIQQERDEAMSNLEWWKNHDVNNPSCNCKSSLRILNSSYGFTKFSLSDLETATCNFSESFKIGQGGYGRVYKGELLDRSIVVKKFHLFYRQAQMNFQHQVYALSKLKHPNLVSLVGVCIESWSLVSEYMSNGNLEEQLFRKTKSSFQWTWKERVRVLTEISNGLLYLHSSKSDEFIHGNLKPENILFDSDFKTKISDFSISKLARENDMHSPSFPQYGELKGHSAYKDPEYHRTRKLTPKSDVYSFGIIVLQLLTGRLPEGLTSDVRQAIYGGRLSSVLDTSVGDWPMSVAIRLAEFGLKCCELNPCDRPHLTEIIVRDLEHMQNLEAKHVPNYFQCPILHEIMHDPQIAADGFTYEGQAISDWLENGRDTSPMTNLKLDHLNLTPNHTLHSAIQDWLHLSN